MKTSKKLRLPAARVKVSDSASEDASKDNGSHFAPHSYLQEIIRQHYVAYAWQSQLKKIEGSVGNRKFDSMEF